MLSKKMEVADLFAFYGELLTVKQKDVLSLYCLDDLSLGEIAENLEISRQAVHDSVKRTSNILFGYEGKLGLLKKFTMNTALLNDIHLKMNDLSDYLKDDSIESKSLKNKVQVTIDIVIEDIGKMIE